MSETQQSTSPGARLRALMDAECVAAPGAFNGLVARAVADAGFDAAYVSGGATSAASGVPDTGLLDRTDFVRTIREVYSACGLPIMADADTGFGEEPQVRRTVIEYENAGAAGFHLEDQVFPKRCGHLDGKALIPTDQMASRVAWAAQASRDCSGGDFVICARTDAYNVDGFDAAAERATVYVEAGADMIFPEGMHTRDDFVKFAEAMGELGDKRPYLLANMTEFGKTEIIPLAEFAEMGYDLVIFPVSSLRAAMGAVVRLMRSLRETGSVEGVMSEMQSRKDMYAMLGYEPSEPWEQPGR